MVVNFYSLKIKLLNYGFRSYSNQTSTRCYGGTEAGTYFSTLKRETVENFNENLFKNNFSKNIINVAFQKTKTGKTSTKGQNRSYTLTQKILLFLYFLVTAAQRAINSTP